MTSTAPARPATPGKSFPTAEAEQTRPLRARLAAAARRPYAVDLGVCLLFVVFAAWLTHGLWPDPATRVLALNQEDQTLYEWFLANDTRVFFGDFGLVTHRLNAPDGVNLLANTTVIALGVLFTPVTLAFGVPTTFALIVMLNLAGTAIAWYLLYRRLLGAHRVAAAIGGAFTGFAPGMFSQSNSHLHMTAQWLVPLFVWCVVKIVRAADRKHPDGGAGWPGRLLGAAAALAALVTVQVFIGEEVLFLSAVTLAVVIIGYAAARPILAWRVLPRFLLGMLVATGLATAALAYPLSMQFSGPQSVPNGVFSIDYFSADLASYPAISPLSVAGTEAAARLSTGSAEYNTFLGWPLLLVVLGGVIWLRRHPLVIASVLAGAVMAWLSLGPRVVIDGRRTDIWAPYEMLREVPVIDGALPMRFALALIPLLATVLVIAVDRALRDHALGVRLAVPALVVAALLPIAPAPLSTTSRAAVPEFISGGHWRGCVEPDGVLVPVPLPTPKQPDAMRWSAAANAEFGLPEGFFIGPYAPHGEASMGTYKRPTSALLAKIAETGETPVIGGEQISQAQQDVAFWGASCVVLAEAPHAEQLRTTLEALFGPATRVADAWTWRVG